MINTIFFPALVAPVSTGGFAVDNSAVFNKADSEYFAADSGFGTPTNADVGTLSMWFKRANLGGSNLRLFTHGSGGSVQIQAYFKSDDTLVVGNGSEVTTTQVFRDVHAFSHLVVRVSTGESSSSDRVRLYLNGSQITSFSASSYPGQNDNIFTSTGWRIGSWSGSTTHTFSGYISEIVYCDGQSLAPTAFGEYSDSGVWRPIDISNAGLTFGNNGFYLNMAASGSDLGDDASGNSNDFTNTNAVTQTTDSPTSNFATLTTIDTSPAVFSNGNLQVTSSTSNSYRGGTSSIGLPPGSGKWYVEAKTNGGSTGGNKEYGFGAVTNATDKGQSGYFPGSYGGGTEFGYYSGSGGIIYNDPNSSVGSLGVYGSGTVDTVALRFDMDTSSPTCKFYVNNTLKHTSNLHTGLTYFPHFNIQDSSLAWTVNFGATDFTYTLPTGHQAISAANMYKAFAPTIEDGSAYFQTTLYTGNGASSHEINQSGENSTFAPDLVWTKGLTVTEHRISDVIRGATKVFFTDSSLGHSRSTTETSSVLSFDSDGFTVGSGGGINGSGQAKLAWQWKAGDSNTSVSASGSGDDAICACTHRANQTAGFSLVKYTGRNSDISNGQHSLVTHGLGAKPDAVWIKSIDDDQSWVIMLADSNFGNDAFVSFNSTNDLDGSDFVGYFGGDSTSTHFVVGNDNKVNKNGDEYMAMVFKAIPGFSKFGLFEGNGNADGPYIDLGFKPSWILVKSIDANSRPWVIHDSARNPFNVTDLNLIVNDTSASTSSNLWDFLSNGFKIRDGLAGDNENNKTHIYMAFGDAFAGSTPMTAR